MKTCPVCDMHASEKVSKACSRHRCYFCGDQALEYTMRIVEDGGDTSGTIVPVCNKDYELKVENTI